MMAWGKHFFLLSPTISYDINIQFQDFKNTKVCIADAMHFFKIEGLFKGNIYEYTLYTNIKRCNLTRYNIIN